MVSVVILTFNRREDVIRCIVSLEKSSYKNIELIVVDNASTDGTLLEIRNKFKDVKVIVNKTNLGIAEGRNIGQENAQGEYVLFLDCDTIVDRNMVNELVAQIDSDDSIGLVVPKMYYYEEPNLLWFAGAKLNMFTSQAVNVGAGEYDKGQYDKVVRVSHGPTAFLVSRKVLEKVKGHDKKYFMCYADTDFAFRTRETGFKTVFCPKAILWHNIKLRDVKNSLSYYGFDSLRRTYYYARNRFIFMKTHAPRLNLLIFLVFFAPTFLVFFTYQIVHLGGGFSYLKAYWRGFLDGFLYVFTYGYSNSNLKI